ncbi:MAG: DUF4153 domain-containing protein [Patescibacteria group bacterium]
MRKLSSIVLALVAFNIFFFPFQKNFFGNLNPPIGATLGFVGFIFSFLVFQYLAFFDSSDKTKNKVTHSLTAVSAVLVLLSVFRTSEIDILVLSLLSFASAMLGLYVFSLPKHQTIDSLFEIFIAPIALFFESFAAFFRGLKLLKAPRLNLSRYLNGGVVYVFVGVLIGLPLVAIIVALLSSADPVFSKFVENIVNFKDFPWWFVRGSISRLFYSFFVLLIATATAYLAITKKKNDILVNTNYQNNKLALLATSVVTMVSAVLATYIIIEFPYLFATVSETELKQFGVNTLSEYVTRGFNELMVVSVLVYVTAVVAMAIYKLRGKGSKILGLINLFLLSETLVFVASIFRRVFIYQQEHGLTRIRIYGSVFLVGLIVWTLILMARHVQKNIKWFWCELSVFVLLALTIFVVRPDYLIANKFKPTVNKEVDYVHIARLSAEAVDGWVEGYKDAAVKIETLERKDRTTWTNDDERQAYYAYLTLNILRKNTGKLVLRYGSAIDMWDAKVTYGRPRPLPDFRSINFGEKAAFEKIKLDIGLKNLVEMEEKSYKLLANGKKINIHKKFDRSLKSPLLPDVNTNY